MSHLLAPGDERDLVAFLCETLGAKLLLSDLTTAGKAHLASDPLAALPEALPGPATFGDHAVWTLMFWLQTVGPIRTLADAPSRPPVPQTWDNNAFLGVPPPSRRVSLFPGFPT